MKQSTRSLILIVLTVAIVAAGFYYISNYLTRSRASAARAFVNFTNTSFIIEAEQPSTGTEANKISAFDFTITTGGTEQITQVGSPAAYPSGDTSIFTPIITATGLPAASVRIAYVIQKPTADLPVAIEVPITTNGTGTLSLAGGATQEVVGYIPSASSNSYEVVTSSGGSPFPTQSPQPTTDPGVSTGYTIDVGSRGVLEFEIKDSQPSPGASNTPFPQVTTNPVDPSTPHVKFSAVFESMQKFPDIEVRLKVTDLIAAITPGPIPPLESCQQPGHAEIFYENIQMIADSSGVYSVKSNTPFKIGGTQYSTSDDGWLPLVSTKEGIAYAIAVKGPKHRSQRMTDTVLLQKGKDANQVFDWTGIPIAPGDLPDHNSGNRQDCTVNSLDLARIEGLLAATDAQNLTIADVNYDGVINGNDISKVVNTLSTKPDDD